MLQCAKLDLVAVQLGMFLECVGSIRFDTVRLGVREPSRDDYHWRASKQD